MADNKLRVELLFFREFTITYLNPEKNIVVKYEIGDRVVKTLKAKYTGFKRFLLKNIEN